MAKDYPKTAFLIGSSFKPDAAANPNFAVFDNYIQDASYLSGIIAGAMTKTGVLKMRAGRADEATSLFRRAVEREPANAEALLYLAGALASTGHPAEALPLFERALAAGPRSSMALNGLGLTRLAVGDRTGAAAALSESLRLDPEQPDVARTLAELRGGPRS